MGTHLRLFGIICICESNFDYFDCKFVDLVKVIRRMRDLICLDVKKMKILQNCVLKLSLEAKKLSRGRRRPRTISLTRSFEGFVSSNRTTILPLYILAKYLLRIAAFVWPMWRYPLGSGGKRVTTSPSLAFWRPNAKEDAVFWFNLAFEAFASARPANAACVGSRDSRWLYHRMRCWC
jgi:hypothetical protein